MPLPVTVAVEVAAGVPEHVALFGPYRLNVIVPVGLAPPANVALSEIEPPAATGGEGCEVIVGVAWVTATDSFASLHEVLAAVLLASPR